jgi:hypothetical protein
MEHTEKEVGFIILRHVMNESTNQYWIHCYRCIRKYYPEHSILIIDDNSNDTFVTDEILYKTTVIQSQYPGRGELLPYHYYLHHKLFDTAIILHDSVFINQRIDTTVDTYAFLWEFEHGCDQIEDERSVIYIFNDEELSNFYENKDGWKGCFGSMTIITHDFLTLIHRKYDLSKLLDCILNRYNRCSFERIIGCILHKEGKTKTMFGNIHKYCPWGITFDQKDAYSHLPLIKVWTGR